MKKWNVAVVGCGAISKIYFDNMIYKIDNLNVVACCSRDGESAIRKAKEYGLKSMTLKELLLSSEIDIIVNLTPPTEHYKIIRAALESGKHVYTEKVMALSVNETKQLIDLAKERNLILGSAPDTYLGASIQTAKKAVEKGVIGEVTGCVAVLNRNLSTLYDRLPFLMQPGAGIGYDLGIYYLSALLTIIGPINEVSGRTNTWYPISKNRYQYEIKNENIMVGHMEFENGALGTVMFNGNSIFPEKPYIAIQGTDGILYLPNPDNFGGKVLLQKQSADMEEELELVNPYIEDSRGIGVSELLKALENENNTEESMDIALHAIEVLEGFVESSKTKRFVTINSSLKMKV